MARIADDRKQAAGLEQLFRGAEGRYRFPGFRGDAFVAGGQVAEIE